MNSILLGLLVAGFAWLFMRFMRERALRRLRPRAPAPTDTPKTMPRIGARGTVTKEQLKRLRAYHFEPSRMWSKEEADLILDTVVYLRAAILQVTGNGDPPENVQNQILAFILSDDKLREHVMQWGRDRRNQGSGDAPAPLEPDEHFERVAAFLTGKFQERLSRTGS